MTATLLACAVPAGAQTREPNVFAATPAAPRYVRVYADVTGSGVRGTSIWLIDRATGRTFERVDAGPLTTTDGFDGKRAWHADATGLPIVIGEATYLKQGFRPLLEAHAAALELGDAGDDVFHEPGHLGMSRGSSLTGEEKEAAQALALVKERPIELPGRPEAQLLRVERPCARQVLYRQRGLRDRGIQRFHRTILERDL